MQFKDIEGQQVLINHLTEIIDSGRVSHAQLFLGATANGSLALALAYAQYLNCSNRQHFPSGDLQHSPSGGLRADSCGVCPNCKRFQELAHPDLHLVFPYSNTDSIKGTGISCDDFQDHFRYFLGQHRQLGTEEEWYTHLGIEKKQGMIREKDADNVVRILSLKPYEGGYKTVVIWMAERMNVVAANTLLKTLEEPFDKTLTLMVAESTDQMLSTVLSRVQQVVVPGNTSRFKGEQRQQFAAMFVDWMRMLFKLNMQNLANWVDQIALWGREPQKHFLQFAQESMRACFLRTASGLALEEELHFGDEKFDSAFPAMVTPNNVEQIERALTDAIYAIERNAYAKITFMQLSFALSKAIKNR